jgi:hypothetical protein
MSIYGYLNCHNCRQTLWLGKALHRANRPYAFHIGEPEEPPHWARPQLNQILWKFMADHAGHRIDVRLEHEMTEEMFGYQNIGGDTNQGVSFEAYLTGWPGLTLGNVEQARTAPDPLATHCMSATPPEHYSTAGIGRTSRLAVEIDEALDDSGHVQMSINAPSWSFRFGLSSRDEVARILSFLREHAGRLEFSELVVGSFHGTPVRLIKDDEFADRFWIRSFADGLMVEFVLAADDLTEFTDAVAQAVADLQR